MGRDLETVYTYKTPSTSCKFLAHCLEIAALGQEQLNVRDLIHNCSNSPTTLSSLQGLGIIFRSV